MSVCDRITRTAVNKSGVVLQGLEAGLLVGVILCALHFAYEYSLMQLVSMTVLPSRSHAMLPFRYQQVLALFQDHITAVSVSGTQPLFHTTT